MELYWIYLLEARDPAGYSRVKIGRTKNFKRRYRELERNERRRNPDNPRRIRFLFAFQTKNKYNQDKISDRLREYRCEFVDDSWWYRYSPDVRKYVKLRLSKPNTLTHEQIMSMEVI